MALDAKSDAVLSTRDAIGANKAEAQLVSRDHNLLLLIGADRSAIVDKQVAENFFGTVLTTTTGATATASTPGTDGAVTALKTLKREELTRCVWCWCLSIRGIAGPPSLT